MSAAVEIVALAEIGEIEPGAELGGLIATAAAAQGLDLGRGDVVVISQKVVSKAEGRLVELATVEPGERARKLAAEHDKDPRLVELVLAESRRIVRAIGGVLITETNGGWICANAGIDSSNVPGDDTVALLPLDADASARTIRRRLGGRVAPAVVISDSFGRPWRLGQTESAIGVAGLRALDDWRGETDSHGRTLAATAIAVGDQIAAAADLARTKTSATPVVLVRGAARWWTEDDGPGAATALQRPADDDLFR